MTSQNTSLLDSGQRVGLAVLPFKTLFADFAPFVAANDERAELVAAIEAKTATQDQNTGASTTAKDTARKVMGRATEVLSLRAVGYALAAQRLDLVQLFRLSYSDIVKGEAAEDVNHVRALVENVGALPAAVRKNYRISEAVLQAPALAADAFEAAETAQTDTKAAPRLATLALPELLRRLGAALALLATLAKGQRTDPDPQWAAMYAAFAEANKRRKVAPAHRPVDDAKPRIVRTLPLTLPDAPPRRLANTNYGPAYTLTVENRSAHALLLWMAQKDGALTTPGRCPAGMVTTLTRAAIGPETARYLMAQFEGGGGQATVVVRRVV